MTSLRSVTARSTLSAAAILATTLLGATVVSGSGSAASRSLVDRLDGYQLTFLAKDARFADAPLWTANADGSQRRVLLAGKGEKQDPHWSPDGDRMVYRWLPRRDYSFTPLVIWNRRTKRSIGLTSKVHIAGYSPSWSPDGRRLVIAGRKIGQLGPLQLWIAQADGSRAKRITNQGREAQYPAWAPDGKRIAFVLAARTSFHLYTISPDGTKLRQLTRGTSLDHWPAWSPNSRSIIFQRDRGAGQTAVWIMNADGSNQRVLTGKFRAGAPLAWEPAPLPTFQCRPRAAGPVVTICVSQRDGSQVTPLLGGRDAGFPAWRRK